MILRRDGADGASYLEPIDLSELLSELENWSVILKSDPELTHRLAEFEAAASGGDRPKAQLSPHIGKSMRRPSGPSL